MLCATFSFASRSQQSFLTDENSITCPHAKKGAGIFKGLKNLALYVNIQEGIYERALNCAGVEKECVQASMSQPGGELEKQYIDEMIENKKYYKAPIQKNNLIKIFKERLESEILPYVALGKNCTAANVAVIDGDFASSEMPSTLTYILTLNISRHTKPEIAILNWTVYRPDINRINIRYPIAYNNVAAIPLDISDEEIAKHVSLFASSIQHPRKVSNGAN